MSYLPDTCIWKDLDKVRTEQVMDEFDLSSMKLSHARVHFDDHHCKIQVCANAQINNKPFYLLTCDPPYGDNKKVTKLLLKMDQREQLRQMNPYSKDFRNLYSPDTVSSVLSPNSASVLSPIPFSAGTKRKRRRRRRTRRRMTKQRHRVRRRR